MQIRKLAPGDRLLDYRILEKIGEGGFGEVFRAEHEVLGRIVAIKVPRDLEALSALRLEGVIQSTLDHPSIVKTLEISISHDPPYVVLEHVDGMSLAEILKKEGPLHWKRASRILLEAGRALKHAHERGVVHGDVKPGNVLVEPGEEGRVRLTDFGLGRVFEGPRGNMQISRSLELATSGNEVQGTLRYLAPEVQRGEPADERSDIYSWGVLLFESVTGKLPEGREVPSDLVKSVPWELDQVFEACFHRREKRPRSLDSGIAALERLLTVGTRARNAPLDEDLAKASRAIPFRAHDGVTLVTPIKTSPRESANAATVSPAAETPAGQGRPETADALHVLRMLGTPSQTGALPALPADGASSAPAPAAAQASAAPSVPRVAPGVAPPELDLGAATRLARTDPAFQAWRNAFVGIVRSRFESRPAGTTVVAAEGFDVGVGVTTEGEPHHRIYAAVLPYVDLETARRLVKTARQVFEREKGIWEKEVTFALLTREVREKEPVLMALRSLPMGWWRRRRVVLHDLSQDRLYATELGCDPRGNPLKRLFFDAVREASFQTSRLADAANRKGPCRPMSVRAGREAIRGGLMGVGLALVATLGLMAGAISVEKAHNRMQHHRKRFGVCPVSGMRDVGPSMRADPHVLEGAFDPFRPTAPAPILAPAPDAPTAPAEIPHTIAVPAPVAPQAAPAPAPRSEVPATPQAAPSAPSLDDENDGWLDPPESTPAPAPRKVFRF